MEPHRPGRPVRPPRKESVCRHPGSRQSAERRRYNRDPSRACHVFIAYDDAIGWVQINPAMLRTEPRTNPGVGLIRAQPAWLPGRTECPDVTGHVSCRDAEGSQQADHQVRKVLADPLATPQHLADRRGRRRHARPEGEIALDARVDIQQHREDGPLRCEARCGVGPCFFRRLRERTVEYEFRGLPAVGSTRRCHLCDSLPRRRRGRIRWIGEADIDRRVGRDLEYRVGASSDSQVTSLPKWSLPSRRHDTAGAARTSALSTCCDDRFARPQMREMHAKIDRRAIVVTGYMSNAIDHAAPRNSWSGVSAPPVRAVDSTAK